MGAFDGRDPLEDYRIINEELKQYNYQLEKRSQIVVANKMDLPDAEENYERFVAAHPDIPVMKVSALTQQGLEDVMLKTADLLEKAEEDQELNIADFKIYKFEMEEDFKITRASDGVFEVSGERVERLFDMTDFTTYDNVRRFAHKLRKMGIDDELRKQGIQSGDIVRIKDYEFEFMD